MPKPKAPKSVALDEALSALDSLSSGKFELDRLDKVYDTLRLLGVVLGHMALLKLATDPEADSRARVSAARALLLTRESPESIAERLRRSTLANLTVAQLETMVQQAEAGEDITQLFSTLQHKDSAHGTAPQSIRD